MYASDIAFSTSGFGLQLPRLLQAGALDIRKIRY
jgi:hypothetical protein